MHLMESATMSTSKLTPTDLPRPTPPTSLTTSAQETATALADTGRAAAFWTATSLPLVYLPLLLGGYAGDHPLTVAALITLNALTLLFGHDHEPGT